MADENKPNGLDPNSIEARTIIGRDIKERRDNINKINRGSGFSDTYGSIGDIFRGIDHRNAGSSYQKNNDHQGLTLFTRPMFNLTYNNVLADRQLHPLLAEDTRHMYRAIRVMLDPQISKRNVESDIFDNRQAFITLLSGTLLNISGFPVLTINSYTSPEGVRKESYSIVDDVAEINSAFDMTATFANIQGDPITTLFQTWSHYMGNVYSGDMVPYPDFIVENEIDYQTRIWRLVLDSSKRYVKKIGCANACFPLASPLGAAFNYTNDRPYSDGNDQISIPFRCVGAEYNDPLLFDEFNLTVQYFNPEMRDGNRDIMMHRLSDTEVNAFNYRGYPRIDPKSLRLEWWINKSEYRNFLGDL